MAKLWVPEGVCAEQYGMSRCAAALCGKSVDMPNGLSWGVSNSSVPVGWMDVVGLVCRVR